MTTWCAHLLDYLQFYKLLKGRKCILKTTTRCFFFKRRAGKLRVVITDALKNNAPWSNNQSMTKLEGAPARSPLSTADPCSTSSQGSLGETDPSVTAPSPPHANAPRLKDSQKQTSAERVLIQSLCLISARITASDSSCYIYFMSIIQLCEVLGHVSLRHR